MGWLALEWMLGQKARMAKEEYKETRKKYYQGRQHAFAEALDLVRREMPREVREDFWNEYDEKEAMKYLERRFRDRGVRNVAHTFMLLYGTSRLPTSLERWFVNVDKMKKG